MNKYTKQLQSKFDELYEEYADDFCPSELHDDIRQSLEEDIETLSQIGCLFSENTPSDFEKNLCVRDWPCMICCMKSHIRSWLYQECGIFDEMVKINNETVESESLQAKE